MMKLIILAVMALGLLSSPAMARDSVAPVVMISIDGFRAEDLAHPDAAGVRLPHLQALARDGVQARAVVNVAPTLTYPNHTTLMTGVAPNEHGIVANQRFDPEGVLHNSVYWFAREIAVPTLWDAVHRSGGRVANVYWPVAVGSRSIDVNFPELWAGGQPKDWPLIAAVSDVTALPVADRQAPRGALERLIAPTTAGDAARVDLALSLFTRERPRLLTVHLVSLDETQHHRGIDSAEKRRALEALDVMVGHLVDGVRAVDCNVRVVVVSDHGQVPLSRQVNLGTLLSDAGLAASGTDWRAAIWNVGSAYLVVRTGDAAAQTGAMRVLARYAARSDSAIARIVPMDRVVPDRPDAHIAAMIFFKSGLSAGSATTGPLVTPATDKGQHGGSPDEPGLRSVFIANGPGVPKGRALGVVDMRAIAPTVAKLLDAPMPSAYTPPLF